MTGEVVDKLDGVDRTAQANSVTEKMELDDLERRTWEAIKLAPEAMEEGNGDALEGIAYTILAFKRKECEP